MSAEESPDGQRDLEALSALPTHTRKSRDAAREHSAARRAFVRAFDEGPAWRAILRGVGSAALPVVLASVVGLYLFWAFAAAMAINP